MPTQSRLSSLYYRREITTTDGTDITADPVWFAFVPQGYLPDVGDWHSATFDGANVWSLLIGPDGVPLDPGFYIVWQKVTDSPEVYAEVADSLRVT